MNSQRMCRKYLLKFEFQIMSKANFEPVAKEEEEVNLEGGQIKQSKPRNKSRSRSEVHVPGSYNAAGFELESRYRKK